MLPCGVDSLLCSWFSRGTSSFHRYIQTSRRDEVLTINASWHLLDCVPSCFDHGHVHLELINTTNDIAAIVANTTTGKPAFHVALELHKVHEVRKVQEEAPRPCTGPYPWRPCSPRELPDRSREHAWSDPIVTTWSACTNLCSTFLWILRVVRTSSSLSPWEQIGYKPHKVLNNFMRSKPNFFVLRSAGFTRVGILWMVKTLCLNNCCKNMCFISTCFSCPTPDLWTTNFAEEESRKSLCPTSIWDPVRNWANRWRYIHSTIVEFAAYNSAPHEERATVAWALQMLKTKHPLANTIPEVVDLRVDFSSHQLLSLEGTQGPRSELTCHGDSQVQQSLPRSNNHKLSHRHHNVEEECLSLNWLQGMKPSASKQQELSSKGLPRTLPTPWLRIACLACPVQCTGSSLKLNETNWQPHQPIVHLQSQDLSCRTPMSNDKEAFVSCDHWLSTRRYKLGDVGAIRLNENTFLK